MKQEQDGFINYIGNRPMINQFDEALIHYREGRLERALKCINRHIKGNRDDVQAHYMKTHLLECLERWHEAIECIKKIWNAKEAAPDMMLLRAMQYAHIGDKEAALKFIDEAEEAGAHAGDVYRYRAKIMYDMTITRRASLMDDAARWILEACSMDPLNEAIHGEAASILYEKFREAGCTDKELLKKSIMYGRKATELGDMRYSTHYNLGRAWYHMGKMDAAIKHFEKTAKIDRGFANAQAMIGASILKQEKDDKDRKRAARYLEKALEMNPKLGFALQSKAKIQINDGSFSRVQVTLKDLAKVEPKNAQAWICLAVTYAEQYAKSGDRPNQWAKMERAAQCVERAAAANPKYNAPAPGDIERAASSSKKADRLKEYAKYTVLDHRYDESAVVI